MEYITSMQAAELTGFTKRHINNMCANGELPGAYKKGYRWMIPMEVVSERITNRTKRVRTFNTTGVCNPEQHYMVDLAERLAQVRILVDAGNYFTINRARQFGKTTTLNALTGYLNHEYYVVSMDFQMQMSNAKFKNENSFALAFAKAFIASFRVNKKSGSSVYEAAISRFAESFSIAPENYELVELFQALSALCGELPEDVVLMIDEVDSATNNQVFLDFLAQLRGYYINRSRFATFKSVILAGVCDIKNLKRKLRPDEEHKDNSPWNIAADFDIDMSFSPVQITEMLEGYEDDHKTGMDIEDMAQEIYAYTSGYPYLVSRLCQLLDNQIRSSSDKGAWTRNALLEAVRNLVKESNSLFDDMAKKVKDYPELKTLLYDILFCGRSIPYNLGTELVSIGTMFGFLKDDAGQVAISNRIFEIWFYNLFIAEEAMNSDTYQAGQKNKNQFVDENGLNLELVLKKFVQHFTESFSSSTDKFIEDNGRKLFLLYIRPLINGSGNYYIEARTRSMGRTDLIIDFQGKQYIVEMKIWHGEEYNARGEEQLLEYLKDYNLKKGYMLSFNFNKKKEVGVKELHFKDATIVEAVV
ncbi:MAG: helix-turn-helix domain-containing protein [Lachnospiraceae bacterium]|nr:helix-turn-helix domain-containing protein [Lachnospiraceae bacterium]